MLSLILPHGMSFAVPRGPRFSPHYFHSVHVNIGKKNRSNTPLSPGITTFMNNMV